MTTNTLPLFPLEGRFSTDHQPSISTLPFIRSESFEPNRMGEEYADTTLAPQPTNNVVFVTDTTSAQGASETPSSPLDVTMLAMLGLTIAGAGVMKSQRAVAKKNEQATQKAQALAQLQAQQSAQA
jgi:hypothetical protein